MIGVLAHRKDHVVVREFFELFKTPWELFQNGRTYDVLLCVDQDCPTDCSARLVIVYGPTLLARDQQALPQSPAGAAQRKRIRGRSLPIYQACATLAPGSEEIAFSEEVHNDIPVIRIGYRLFAEVAHLLTEGQPPENADVPTLDLHIQILRELIVGHGVPLVEVPPVPAGCRFIACLTHDIDFLYLRQHRFDHTLAGFVSRATIGSLMDFFGGRKSFRKLCRNWFAALKMPLVQLGICADFWPPFDPYLRVEDGRPSTFFIVPFKNRPGKPLRPGNNAKRATAYDIGDITPWLAKLKAAGCEVALHGLDAWDSTEAATTERNRIREFTGEAPPGVRMHWLYFNANSPRVLDDATFQYDSTCGFNDAVGFRAGTTQVFKPLNAEALLEVPMHIQDTALFYPGRMHLTETQAWDKCVALISSAQRQGGVLTLLWHDRSLVPERLWGEFYARLIKELDSAIVWFATAREVAEWFRERRTVSFAGIEKSRSEVIVSFSNIPAVTQRDLIVRTWSLAADGTPTFSDVPLEGRKTVRVPLPSAQASPRGRAPGEKRAGCGEMAAAFAS